MRGEVRPELLRPELLRPELLRPELLRPELLRPELLRPELLRPELLRPELLRRISKVGTVMLMMGIVGIPLSSMWLIVVSSVESVGERLLIGVCVVGSVVLTVSGVLHTDLLTEARVSSRLGYFVAASTMSVAVVLAADCTSIAHVVMLQNRLSLGFGIPVAVSNVVGTCCLLVVANWSCKAWTRRRRGSTSRGARSSVYTIPTVAAACGEYRQPGRDTTNCTVFISPPSYESLFKDTGRSVAAGPNSSA